MWYNSGVMIVVIYRGVPGIDWDLDDTHAAVLFYNTYDPNTPGLLNVLHMYKVIQRVIINSHKF